MHPVINPDVSLETWIGETAPSPETRALRIRYVGEYLEWLAEREISPLEAQPRHITNFLDAQREYRSVSTRRNVSSHLRTYYSWIERHGYINRSPLAHLKIEIEKTAAPKSAKVDHLRKLLHAANSDREWALIALLSFNSMKASELLACNISNLETRADGTVLHFNPSGESKRPPHTVIIDEVACRLERQFEGRTSGPLFLKRNNERMGRHSATDITQRAGRRAGLDYKVTPQLLANTMQAVALQYGFSYRGIVRAMGIPDRRYSARWLGTVDGLEQDHAAARLARLVLNDPDAPDSWLLHADQLLLETDLPQPFAVMAAGAIFERHLRAWCIAENFPGIKLDPKDGKISQYLDLLYRNQKVTLAEKRSGDRIGDDRNNAAHGAFELLAPDAGRETLRNVRRFVHKHPIPDVSR